MAAHEATQADFSFVHFTDTHIMDGGFYRPSVGDWHLDTTATLRRVIDVLCNLKPRPAFAVIGGDLASPDVLDREKILTAEDYEPSYRLLQQLIQPLPYPVHMLLGNHDNRPAFHRVMQTNATTPEVPHYYSFDHQGHHFLVLDSHEPGEPGGVLDPEQLAWLRQDLQAHQDQPTLAFVHHHPVPIGHTWLDTMPLHNGADLLKVLQEYNNVRWIICGHVHMDHTVHHDGLTMFTSPATCFQTSKVTQERKTLSGPPGFRIVRIQGLDLSTRVVHLHGDSIDQI